MRQLLAVCHAPVGGTLNINTRIVGQSLAEAPLDAGGYNTGYAAAWAPDGRRLYIGQGTTTPYYRVFNAADMTAVAGLPALATQVNALDVSPDGSKIAVGYYNSPWLQIRDATTLALIASPTLGNRAHSVAWSRDGSRLAVAYLGSPYLRVYNTSDWSLVAGTPTLAGAGYGLAWGPGDATLVVLHQNSPMLRVYNTSDWSLVAGTPTNPGGGGIGISASFSPDGSMVALGFQGAPYLKIFDPTDWSELAAPAGVLGAVTEVDFSADGTRLAVSHQSSEPRLRVFDVSTWASLPNSPSLPASAFACRFSPLLDEPSTYPATDQPPGDSFALGWSGHGVVSGTTEQRVSGSDVPMRAKVSLLRIRDKRLVRRTWSDPATGAYSFDGIDTSREHYVALAEYPNSPDNPEAENYLRPVAGVSPLRGQSS